MEKEERKKKDKIKCNKCLDIRSGKILNKIIDTNMKLSVSYYSTHIFFWGTRGNKGAFWPSELQKKCHWFSLAFLEKSRIQTGLISVFWNWILFGTFTFVLTHSVFCLLKGTEKSLVLPTHPCFGHNGTSSGDEVFTMGFFSGDHSHCQIKSVLTGTRSWPGGLEELI